MSDWRMRHSLGYSHLEGRYIVQYWIRKSWMPFWDTDDEREAYEVARTGEAPSRVERSPERVTYVGGFYRRVLDQVSEELLDKREPPFNFIGWILDKLSGTQGVPPPEQF